MDTQDDEVTNIFFALVESFIFLAVCCAVFTHSDGFFNIYKNF